MRTLYTYTIKSKEIVLNNIETLCEIYYMVDYVWNVILVWWIFTSENVLKSHLILEFSSSEDELDPEDHESNRFICARPEPAMFACDTCPIFSFFSSI